MANIPRDPEMRAKLAELAGLTDEEQHAIDQSCYQQEHKRARGVITTAEAEGEHRV